MTPNVWSPDEWRVDHWFHGDKLGWNNWPHREQKRTATTATKQRIRKKNMDYFVRNTYNDMTWWALKSFVSRLDFIHRLLCVHVLHGVLFDSITKLQFVNRSTAASLLTFSYQRILGADLSSVTVLRSLTPWRMITSISTAPLFAEDRSWGALRAVSPDAELGKGKWPSPRACALAASSPIFSTRLWRLAASCGSSSTLWAATSGACWV